MKEKNERNLRGRETSHQQHGFRKRMLMNEQGAGVTEKDSSWEAVRHGITVGRQGKGGCTEACPHPTHLWRNVLRSQDWSWCLQLGGSGESAVVVKWVLGWQPWFQAWFYHSLYDHFSKPPHLGRTASISLSGLPGLNETTRDPAWHKMGRQSTLPEIHTTLLPW